MKINNRFLIEKVSREVIGKGKCYFRLVLVTLLVHPISLLHADVTVDANQVAITKLRIKAGLFLSQATLGYLPHEVIFLADRMNAIGETAALNEWITNEFSKSYQSMVALADKTIAQDEFDDEEDSSSNPDLNVAISHYQPHIWWDRAIRGNDRLRQRVAWGLSQIFVTSGNVDQGRLAARWKQPLYYYDTLLQNAFGNYRNLLEDITYHPFMGINLSHLKNGKGDPDSGVFADENFAREILQLFSGGVYLLYQNGNYVLDSNGNPRENYDNDDIKELAKVFTGLTYADEDGGVPTANRFYVTGRNYKYPMRMVEAEHDISVKNFLGRTLPGGRAGDVDISETLDIIAAQHSVPQFMARSLINRFTTSNPSAGYIIRVNQAWRNTDGVRGDFKAVLRAILMDAEARNSIRFRESTLADGKVLIQVDSWDPLHGRLKEPVLMMSQFLRRYIPISSEPSGTLKMWNLDGSTRQPVMRAPSVFNYYSAEYQPGTGPLADASIANNEDLVMPECELLPVSCIPMYEGILNIARLGSVVQLTTSESVPAEMTRLQNDRSRLGSSSSINTINNINMYLCNGMMPDSMKVNLSNIMNQEAPGDERFSRIMAIVLSSADYAVSH